MFCFYSSDNVSQRNERKPFVFQEDKTTGNLTTCPLCDACFCVECFRNYSKDKDYTLKCPRCNQISLDFLDHLDKKTICRVYARENLKLMVNDCPHATKRAMASALRKLKTVSDNDLETMYNNFGFYFNQYFDTKDYLSIRINDELKRLKAITTININTLRVSDFGRYLTLEGLSTNDAWYIESQPVPCANALCCGFLLSDQTCYKCHYAYCRSCDTAYRGEHTCDPAELENVRAIRLNSTQCPCCHVYIYRISGCLSLTCTNCGLRFRTNGDIAGIGSEHYNANAPRLTNERVSEKVALINRFIRRLTRDEPGYAEQREILGVVTIGEEPGKTSIANFFTGKVPPDFYVNHLMRNFTRLRTNIPLH